MADQYRELTRLAAQLARRAVRESGKDVAVAGALPPLEESYRADLVPPAHVAAPIYRGVVEALRDAADLYLCETMSSAAEARNAASAALDHGEGKPVYVSWTLDEMPGAGLRSGETVRDAVAALAGLEIAGYLFNCTHPEAIEVGLRELRRLTGKPVGCYPNRLNKVPAGWDPRQRDRHRTARRPAPAPLRGRYAALHRRGRDPRRRLLRHRPAGHPRFGGAAVGVALAGHPPDRGRDQKGAAGARPFPQSPRLAALVAWMADVVGTVSWGGPAILRKISCRRCQDRAIASGVVARRFRRGDPCWSPSRVTVDGGAVVGAGRQRGRPLRVSPCSESVFDVGGDPRPGGVAIHALDQQFVVGRVRMAEVRSDGQIDRGLLQLSGGRRSPHATGTASAGVAGDLSALRRRAARVQFADAFGEGGDVGIVFLRPAYRGAFAGPRPCVGVGQTLLLGLAAGRLPRPRALAVRSVCGRG